jgi:hypothetical protein
MPVLGRTDVAPILERWVPLDETWVGIRWSLVPLARLVHDRQTRAASDGSIRRADPLPSLGHQDVPSP